MVRLSYRSRAKVRTFFFWLGVVSLLTLGAYLLTTEAGREFYCSTKGMFDPILCQ